MKYLYFLVLIGLTQVSFGQNIISPDTVCVGTSVPFSLQGGAKFATYAWSFNGGALLLSVMWLFLYPIRLLLDLQ